MPTNQLNKPQNNQNQPMINSQTAILKDIGLADKEALIWQTLLKLGPVPAQPIIKATQLKRATVYDILNRLSELNLVEQYQDKKKTHFRVKHPYNLKEYVENRVSQIKLAENKLDSIISQFISDYNLQQNKPGIKFYEGLEGVKKVLADTLASKSEIYAYVDLEVTIKNKDIQEIDGAYVKKREKLDVRKKLIIVDSTEARKIYQQPNTKNTAVKFISPDVKLFNTGAQIYDNKIAYITISEQGIMSVIITDKNIYEMHKTLFEYTWNRL